MTIVAVLDQGVLQGKSTRHAGIRTDTSISMQRRLNFEMSVRSLMQSFKIATGTKDQGFEQHDVSTTRSRSSPGRTTTFCRSDVIEQELILFVTLNVNKNTEPVRARQMSCRTFSLWSEAHEARRSNAREPAAVFGRWTSSRPSATRTSARSSTRPAGRTRHSCFRCRPPPTSRSARASRGCDVGAEYEIALRTQDESRRDISFAHPDLVVTRRTQSRFASSSSVSNGSRQ